MKPFVIIVALLQLLLLSGSAQSDKQHLLQNIQTTDSIVIGFKDASVPPTLHRSYEMLFTPTKAQYRLYAYDSTLLVENIAFSKAQFDELTSLFAQYQIKKGKPNGKTRGCTGGTSRYVQGFTVGKAVLNGSVYYCGGHTDGNIDGQLPELCRVAKKYFPKAIVQERD